MDEQIVSESERNTIYRNINQGSLTKLLKQIKKENVELMLWAVYYDFCIKFNHQHVEIFGSTTNTAVIKAIFTCDSKQLDAKYIRFFEPKLKINNYISRCYIDYQDLKEAINEYSEFIPLDEEYTPLGILSKIYGSIENLDALVLENENEIRSNLIKNLEKSRIKKEFLNAIRIADSFKNQNLNLKRYYSSGNHKPDVYQKETLALLISLYLNNEDARKALVLNNIDMERICNKFNIDENLLPEMSDETPNNINEYIDFFEQFSNFDINLFATNWMFNPIWSSIGDEIDGEKIASKMKQFYSLRVLSEKPISPITALSPQTLASYTGGLEELIEQINDANNTITLYSKNEINTEEVKLIVGNLESFSNQRKKKFLSAIFGDRKSSINLSVLNNLNELLDKNIEKFNKELDVFSYLKKLIAIYIYKSEDVINELKHKADKRVENPEASLIESEEEKLEKDLILGKINDFNSAIILMMNDYKRLSLLEKTHFEFISKMNLTKSIIIPSLRTNLSISNGLINQREISEQISFVNEMLTNMTNLNNQGLIKSLETSTISLTEEDMPKCLKKTMAEITGSANLNKDQD